MLLIRDDPHSTIWLMYSSNGGSTWTTPAAAFSGMALAAADAAHQRFDHRHQPARRPVSEQPVRRLPAIVECRPDLGPRAIARSQFAFVHALRQASSKSLRTCWPWPGRRSCPHRHDEPAVPQSEANARAFSGSSLILHPLFRHVSPRTRRQRQHPEHRRARRRGIDDAPFVVYHSELPATPTTVPSGTGGVAAVAAAAGLTLIGYAVLETADAATLRRQDPSRRRQHRALARRPPGSSRPTNWRVWFGGSGPSCPGNGIYVERTSGT